MAFKDQVEDLTSLTVSDTDELTQFLKDGVIDVTNKTISINPSEGVKFQRQSNIIDTNGGFDSGGAKILSVIREAGADGSSDGTTVWEICRKADASMQSIIMNEESLNYASVHNPAYIIDNNSEVNVYPVPSSNNGYRVFYVNNVPHDKTNGAALTYAHSDIGWFPADRVYLVVIYAGMKLIQVTMAAKTVSASPPVPPSLQSTSISFSGTAPTYTKSIQSFSAGQFDTFLTSEEDAELAQVQLGKMNNELSQYQTNIQNELHEFNKENIEYQADLQIAIQNAQLENQDDAHLLQKFQAEYSGYAAQINKDVTEYNWLQGQYGLLKAQYNEAFSIAAPKPQQQGR